MEELLHAIEHDIDSLTEHMGLVPPYQSEWLGLSRMRDMAICIAGRTLLKLSGADVTDTEAAYRAGQAHESERH